MQLTVQKRIAAAILKCGENRIWLDNSRLEEIKEAITKADIKSLINDGAISARPVIGISRAHARKIALQKRKGRRRGHGSIKGKRGARLPRKLSWMRTIRLQRSLLKEWKEKQMITTAVYRILYMRAKSGSFRSIRHMKMYAEEHKLIKKAMPK